MLFQARVSSSVFPRRHSRSGKCPSQKMDQPLQASPRCSGGERLHQVVEGIQSDTGSLHLRLSGRAIGRKSSFRTLLQKKT
jgi:hypothetical protein